jgi:hypothetical protein
MFSLIIPAHLSNSSAVILYCDPTITGWKTDTSKGEKSPDQDTLNMGRKLTPEPDHALGLSRERLRSGGSLVRRSLLRRSGRIGLWLGAVLLLVTPGLAQPQQPFPDETVTQLLTAALYQYFDPDSRFEVSASGSHLVADVLTVDDLFISGKPAVLHGLRGEVLTHMSGLEVDLAALTSQTFKARQVREATVVGKTTAAAVQDALSHLSASILNPRVHFQEGYFTVTATVRREGRSYPMEARGMLVIVQAQQVNVALSEVQVAGTNVPGDLVDKELARINPIVNLANWPVPLYIQRLVLHKDAIELLATNGN